MYTGDAAGDAIPGKSWRRGRRGEICRQDAKASPRRRQGDAVTTLNPSAWYVHCFGHQLQLVVVAVAKTNRVVSDFFNVITLIVNMSGSSCKRVDKLRQSEHDRIIQRLETGEITSGRGKNQETGLARPCDTRWGSQYITLLRLHSLWPSVIEVLENVYDDGNNSDTRESDED